MILLSASSSYFTLAVPMHEVPCVGYTPHAWDPRSLQSIRNGLMYFRPLNSLVPKWSPLFSILVWFARPIVVELRPPVRYCFTLALARTCGDVSHLIRAIFPSSQISYLSTDLLMSFLFFFQSFCSRSEGTMKFAWDTRFLLPLLLALLLFSKVSSANPSPN